MAVMRKRARRRKMAKRKVSAPRRKVARRKSRAPRRKAVKRKASSSSMKSMKQPSVLEVMRGRRKVGSLRARSNVVSWKPRGARRWYNMRADKVGAFFMEKGKAAKR